MKTSFISIQDIPIGTVETIVRHLKQILVNKHIDIAKLRGFGSDGAAVMTGRVNGVAQKLKMVTPRLIAVHCVNHQLALAALHAADGIPYLQKYKSILQSIFYFYQNSAVRMANLHKIQEILNDPIVKCKLVKDVRWLSHDMAIFESLPSSNES